MIVIKSTVTLRYVHMGRRSLTLHVIVTTASHITSLVLHERNWLVTALGYLRSAIGLDYARAGAYISAVSNNNSVPQRMTSPV